MTNAEREMEVYNFGYEACRKRGIEDVNELKEKQDDFWDRYQENGERRDYSYAFSGNDWTAATFTPKYDIEATKKADHIFFGCTYKGSLKERLEALGVRLIIGGSFITAMFRESQFTELPDLDFSEVSAAGTRSSLFYGMQNLTKIGTIKVKANSVGFTNGKLESGFKYWFGLCKNLQEVRFESTGTMGAINYSGMDLSACKLLSKESLLNIIGQLHDIAPDGMASITLGATNLNKLTDEEIAVATEKGWTLV